MPAPLEELIKSAHPSRSYEEAVAWAKGRQQTQMRGLQMMAEHPEWVASARQAVADKIAYRREYGKKSFWQRLGQLSPDAFNMQ